MEAFPDGVIITNKKGNILLGNDSANEVFGVNDLPTDMNLHDFLSASDLKIALSEQSAPPWTTTVEGADKKKRPILMSKFLLPEEYDHVILVLKEVSELQWTTDLQRLRAALAEASSQVRVPLSLVSSFVQEIDGAAADKSIKELAKRAQQQLGRVELTYDRIFASYDANKLPAQRKMPVDVDQVLRHVLDGLPESDREIIDWKPAEASTIVSADPYRLLFVLESMLTYLLRSRASANRITIKESQSGNKAVQVVMEGPVAPVETNGELERIVEETRMEIALGEPLLKKIAGECGGTFVRQPKAPDQEQLIISMKEAAHPSERTT